MIAVLISPNVKFTPQFQEIKNIIRYVLHTKTMEEVKIYFLKVKN